MLYVCFVPQLRTKWLKCRQLLHTNNYIIKFLNTETVKFFCIVLNCIYYMFALFLSFRQSALFLSWSTARGDHSTTCWTRRSTSTACPNNSSCLSSSMLVSRCVQMLWWPTCHIFTCWLTSDMLFLFFTSMWHVYSVTYIWRVYGVTYLWHVYPEGRPGMSDVPLLSGISGLSFDSSFLSPLLFFLPYPLALSVLSFFC